MQALLSKRTVALVAGVIAMAVAAGLVYAQPNLGPQGPRPVLRAYLHGLKQCNLSQEQMDKVKAVLEGGKTTMQALGEQRKADRTALKAALDAEKPDPTAIGNAMLKLKGDREVARAEVKKIHDGVLALLNPDQRARFEGYLEGLKATRRARIGRPAVS